ncbi:MAG: tRNA (adenosine(37)-N6)-dimethylallyltransferase MiaA [Candidatus Nitrohelix vancouverensis]|uniref:tRNA dimethylallyltransferase n=1 Tax=Candidatus Nitrohelix vancouverensis TaxID=2705534 RepID=A0A7T0C2A5_9BACT|nr:MAG: tRNA (adenosine(37)-N6)-dimethylallyltransferase MiaA [Candidatus Nitrohelix vancouverensis]
MPPLIILAGPTGSGKTETAVALAEMLQSEVVNADSLQIYKYFDIGTAKPAASLRARVPHHLIDILEPDEEFSAFDFKIEAMRIIENLHQRGCTPILSGGAGLYIKTLTEDFDCGVQIDPELKQRIKNQIVERGAPELHLELKKVDPVSAEKIKPTDPQRIERALCVYYQSQRPLSEFHQQEETPSRHDFPIHTFLLQWERTLLYANINKRVDTMMDAGLLEEVKSLKRKGWGAHLKPFKSIGYAQLAEHLEGQCSLSDAVDKIKQETRRYAKRQTTWFKKIPGAIPIPATPDDNAESLRDKISRHLNAALASFLVAAFLCVFAPAPVEAEETALQQIGRKINHQQWDQASKLLKNLQGQQDKQTRYLQARIQSATLNGASEKSLDALEAELNQLIEVYPEIEDYIRMDMAQLLLTRKQFKEAILQTQQIANRFPQSVLYHESQSLQAHALERSGQTITAVEHLEKLIQSLEQKASTDSDRELLEESIFQKARLLQASGKHQLAYETYSYFFIHHPATPLSAEAETQKARYELEGKIIKKILSEEEWATRTKGLLKEVRYAQVIGELNRLMKDQGPLPGKFYFYLATAHAGLRDRTQAVATLESFLKRYPEHKRVPEAKYQTGRHLWNLGKNNKAMAYFDSVIKEHPRDDWAVQARYIKGRMYEERKDFKSALEQFRYVAENYPSKTEGQVCAWRMGWIHYLNGDYKSAYEQFAENARRFPSDIASEDNLFWSAKAAYKLGDKEQARKRFQSAFENYPYTYYGLRGKELLTSIDPNAAKLKPRESKGPLDATSPSISKNSQYHLDRAREMIGLGLYPFAERELKQIDGSIRKNYSGVLWLSQLYNQAGSYSSAVRLLQLYRNFKGKEDEKELPRIFWTTYYPSAFDRIIQTQATQLKVDPFFVQGLIKQESLFEADALSSAGARGLMQIMPATGRRIKTYKNVSVTFESEEDLFEPGINISLGIAYLRKLQDTIGDNRAHLLISYNAGPSALKKWLKRFKHIEDPDVFIESIPYPETRGYVKKVLRNYWIYENLYGR